MSTHPNIRSLAVARRVLADPRSSERALRLALADTLQVVTDMREAWLEDQYAWQRVADELGEQARGDLARYRPRRGAPQLRLVVGGRS